jgi:F0F1-type ATP synthase delta subunit
MTSSDPELLIQTILGQIFLTEQLDALHLDLVALKDMSQDGNLERILGESAKNTRQMLAALEKIVGKLISPELKNALLLVLHEQDLDFFSQKRLPTFLSQLRLLAEKVAVAKIKVAIQFKQEDVLAMAKLMAEKVGQQVVFDVTVDKSLIAGMILQYGDYISDYSVATRLSQFRAQWEKAVIEA